jgi:hypothetical protein
MGTYGYVSITGIGEFLFKTRVDPRENLKSVEETLTTQHDYRSILLGMHRGERKKQKKEEKKRKNSTRQMRNNLEYVCDDQTRNTANQTLTYSVASTKR